MAFIQGNDGIAIALGNSNVDKLSERPDCSPRANHTSYELGVEDFDREGSAEERDRGIILIHHATESTGDRSIAAIRDLTYGNTQTVDFFGGVGDDFLDAALIF
ncbi:MAG: hypothetical protein AAFX40_02490 [Cyanobacteria bacterium J06639_1]